MEKAELTEQVREALEEIGTKQRSIKPSVLERYPLLFKCPQVYGRTTSRHEPSLLAEAAHSALLDAVKAIPKPTDRLVAEAALAIGRFEGEEVAARIREIESTPDIGCGLDGYKRRRRKLLPAIAEFLTRDTPGLFPEPSPQTKQSLPAPSVGALTEIAYHSSRLQFAVLIALFVAEFDPQLRQQYESRDVFHPYRYGMNVVWHACSEELFAAYLDFVGTTRQCYKRSGKEIRRRLSEQEFADLDSLIRTCAACGPKSLCDLDYEEYRRFLERWMGAVLPRSGSAYRSSDSYKLGDGSAVGSDSPLPDLYLKSWLLWYDGQELLRDDDRAFWQNRLVMHSPVAIDPPPHFADEAPVSALELMAAKASAIYQLIHSCIDLEQPFNTLWRRQAEKDVVHYYCFDEWLPLFDGKSLRTHVDVFLEQKATELAKSEIVWFDSSS